MKSGTEYELLVQSIYGKLIRNTNINYKKTNIQHNVKLKGKKTGLDHQIDVYCEFTMYDGKVYKYAVECKDYASKLEKNKIAAFWVKKADLWCIIIFHGACLLKSIWIYLKSIENNLKNSFYSYL